VVANLGSASAQQNTGSDIPSLIPSDSPSMVPSDAPSTVPSDAPSMLPSDAPSILPSDAPSMVPSEDEPVEDSSDRGGVVIPVEDGSGGSVKGLLVVPFFAAFLGLLMM